MINDIISINSINERQPLMTGKADEKHTAPVWYGSFYGHLLKIQKRAPGISDLPLYCRNVLPALIVSAKRRCWELDTKNGGLTFQIPLCIDAT